MSLLQAPAAMYDMAWCECASAIVAEMNDWVRLGGGNSGCCGNSAHLYGFHLPASAIPTTDYSRSHEAPAPYNMSWACAGDFGHSGNPGLRARHATVLAGLMAGKYPMICEFIGQPWADKPVYYWARWNGISTLQRYTGSGHDTWSHISWWRSRANERAYLYTGTPVPPQPQPQPMFAPPYPGYYLVYNPSKYDWNVSLWQKRMALRGWTIGVDGYFGNQTLNVVRLFQQEKNISGGVDGIIGPATWKAPWTLPIT